MKNWDVNNFSETVLISDVNNIVEAPVQKYSRVPWIVQDIGLIKLLPFAPL